MLIAKKFELPDECPDNCPYHLGLFEFGMESICTRCPVLLCADDIDLEGKVFRCIEPEDYRDDWAANWVRFFKALPDKEEEE